MTGDNGNKRKSLIDTGELRIQEALERIVGMRWQREDERRWQDERRLSEKVKRVTYILLAVYALADLLLNKAGGAEALLKIAVWVF